MVLDDYLGGVGKQGFVREKELLFDGVDYSGYKIFEGESFVSVMPVLLGEGFPADFSDLLLMRLCFNDFLLINDYLDSGTGLACHPDGSFKVVHDCELLRNINSRTKLVDGVLLLEESVYDSFEGVIFSKNVRKEHTGILLTENEAKNNPVWFELAGRDQNLLGAYVEKVFKYLRDNYKISEGMAVYLVEPLRKPSLGAWCLGGFVNVYCSSRSSAHGSYSLGDCNARLVRVRRRRTE
ncbi:hypothetical protein HY837_01265 [archaeon]|nr:hypothetical protein [archaeon]